MVSGFLCKSIPGADFVARVARALGETEKVPVPFVNHYRGYRLYISHIYYRMHRWPRYFNLCVCVCVFSVLNSEQWHLELFRTGRSHPAWVRSRVDSCVSYTRGRRLYFFCCCCFFFCKCVFVFFKFEFKSLPTWIFSSPKYAPKMCHSILVSLMNM